MGVFYLTVVLSIFALTLFLNLKKTVSESIMLSFLSFFLCPSLVGFVIMEEVSNSSDIVYVRVTNFIFLSINAYLFYKFRNDLMNNVCIKR
jgi:hypothetical protein